MSETAGPQASAATDEPLAPPRRPGLVRFHQVVLDTPDPAGLAQFYCELLGWQVRDDDDDWVSIGDGRSGGPELGFQLAPDHVPPTWPDAEIPQQFHLDFAVDSLPLSGAFAESRGAVRVHGPGAEETFWVYLDPSGHPFCLCKTASG